jgi:trehalose synthase
MRTLEDYRNVVGYESIEELYDKAKVLEGKKVVEINSTAEGGGVAEILNSLIPLMNDVGIESQWKVLEGNPEFFELTKEFHNALQGSSVELNWKKEQLYLQANEAYSSTCSIDADCVVVHDPQPLPLIRFYSRNVPWVWRCHVDLSHPNAGLWELLKNFVFDYDLSVVSSELYRKEGLPHEQKIIFPAIDPLSPKNMDLTDEQVITTSP